MRRRSVVPPMPREVSSARDALRFSWTTSSGRAATICGSSMRMMGRVFSPEQDHEFATRATDVPGADGHDGVAGLGFVEQELDAVLHRAKMMDVLVASFANGVSQSFAGNAGNDRFAGGVDIGK